MIISARFGPIINFELKGKRSRAEPSWKSFSSSPDSSQLGSDSSLVVATALAGLDLVFPPKIIGMYHKVISSKLSRLVTNPRIFRLFMKGNFDPYVLCHLAKKVQNWKVDWSSAHDLIRYAILDKFYLINIRILLKRWSCHHSGYDM